MKRTTFELSQNSQIGKSLAMRGVNLNDMIEEREGKYLFQFGLSFLYPSDTRFKPSDLFGDTAYISPNLENDTYTGRLLKGERVVACVDFNHVNDALVSIHYGTWGGIYFDGRPSLTLLKKWFAWIEQRARTIGVQVIKMKLPPTAFDDFRVSRNLSVFDGIGGYSEVRDYSFISVPCSREEFISSVDSSNRNKMNKCMNAGAAIKFASELSFLKRCHRTIEGNRASKDIPISLSWKRFASIVERHPSKWFGGIVELDDVDIAAGLFLKTNPAAVYVSMWGELPAYKSLSPVASIALALNDHCLREKVAIIDAGTATEDGVVNKGLWDFKTNLGFQETLKLTLEKKLLEN